MARKLPIAETALESILFGLKNVGMAIRLGWVGLLIYGAMIALSLVVFASALPGLPEALYEAGRAAEAAEDPFDGLEFWADTLEEWEAGMDEAQVVRSVILGTFLMLLGSAAFLPVGVVLARIAAGDISPPGGMAYWRWGDREWRTLFTIIGFYVVMTLGTIALAIFTTVVMTGALSNASQEWIPVILGIVMVVVIIWIWLRCSLIIPAAAIENDINFLEAVRATGGNVFRLLGSLIVYSLLIMATYMAGALLFFVLSIVLGIVGASIGAESAAGVILGLLGGGLSLAFLVLASIVSNVSGVAWFAKAWAALRPQALAL